MDVIPYEDNSFYIFDRGYNDFKPMKWKRRFPPESGIQSNAVGYMAGQLTREKYPEKVRRVIYWDNENKRKFIFFTNALTINPVMIAELYHNRWQVELLQVDQATSEDKKVLGYVRKRSPHSDPLCYHSLLYDGNRAEKDEHRTLYLRDAADCKRLINKYIRSGKTSHQNLTTIFSMNWMTLLNQLCFNC